MRANESYFDEFEFLETLLDVYSYADILVEGALRTIDHECPLEQIRIIV